MQPARELTTDAERPGAGRAAGPRARRGLGVAYVVASALAFGSMPILARVAYASGVDPETLLFLRFSIASAVLWVAFLARRAALPRGRSLAVLAAMGALGYAGQAFSYFTALTLASAGLVALLLYLYPALVALLARLVLGHALAPRQVAAVALAFVGSLLTIGRAGDGRPLGIFFGILGAVIYAAYILTGSCLPREVTPTASATVVTTAAALVYAAVGSVRGLHLPATRGGWAAAVAIAIVCTVLAIAFFLAGLERLGPVHASIYSTVEPAFTLLLAAVVLGERVTLSRLCGGAIILGTVVMLARADAGARG